MKHTILVVDDEPHIVRLYDMLLSREGFEVITAGGGEQALQILNSGSTVDLMVIDKRMPKIDGLAVVREMIQRNRIFPIVIITGSLGRQFTEDDLHSTPPTHIKYLTKPCEFDHLLAVIQEMLGISPQNNDSAG